MTDTREFPMNANLAIVFMMISGDPKMIKKLVADTQPTPKSRRRKNAQNRPELKQNI